jgi:hypothetical protein
LFRVRRWAGEARVVNVNEQKVLFNGNVYESVDVFAPL